ncbi:MAG: restriction endonuclease subunit S [Candidatus Cloacimonetes bacterium]|nr:restriction endonuclease subunit S [Candidatus Cloacimonadota bacterium]
MKSVNIGTIANIQAGFQARKGVKMDKVGSHKLVQSKDINHGFTYSELSSFTPESGAKKYAIKTGDVLFQSRGSSHKAYNTKENMSNAIPSASFFILSIKQADVLPEYIAWWFNQPKVQAKIQTMSCGTSISFISKTTLSNLQIQIPEMSVQKKIVNIVNLSRKEQELLKSLTIKRAKLVSALLNKQINPSKEIK